MRPLVGIALLLAVLVAALFLGTRSASVSRPVAVVDPGSRPYELAPAGGSEMESLPAVAPAGASPERAVGRRRAAFDPIPAGTAEASDRAGATAAGDFRLRGSVVSAGRDEPIPGARIEAYWGTERRRVRTAEDGFEVLVPAATLGVTVVDTGGAPHRGARVRVAVKEPDSHARPGFRLDDEGPPRTDRPGRTSGVVVTLSAGPSLVLRVRAVDGGAPPGAVVRARALRGDAGWRPERVEELSTRFVDGRCELDAMLHGPYEVLVVSDDGAFAYLPRIQVTGPAPGDVVLDLLPPATIEIDNRRTESVRVRVRFGAGVDGVVRSCEPGETCSIGVPARTPLVVVWYAGDDAGARSLELEPGEAHRLPVNGAPSSRTGKPGWWNR